MLIQPKLLNGGGKPNCGLINGDRGGVETPKSTDVNQTWSIVLKVFDVKLEAFDILSCRKTDNLYSTN